MMANAQLLSWLDRIEMLEHILSRAHGEWPQSHEELSQYLGEMKQANATGSIFSEQIRHQGFVARVAGWNDATKAARSGEEVISSDNGSKKALEREKAILAEKWWRRLNGTHRRMWPEPHARTHAEPVKVAVIDTGIELSEVAKITYEKNIIKFGCWFSDEPEDVEPCDFDGHGTHCATTLIQAAYGCVALHVARVFDEGEARREGKVGNKLCRRIEKAIIHATDVWNVDIISLSFGLTARDEGVHRAIREAWYKKKLIFAAASNNGSNDEVPYPANAEEVICIHASDYYGRPADFTCGAEEDEPNFMFFGVGVKSQWSARCGGNSRYISGTSCATAIASGFAATILAYVRHLRSKHKGNFENLDRLRESQYMKRVFREMSKKMYGEYRHIPPWQLMKKNEDELAFLKRLSELLC